MKINKIAIIGLGYVGWPLLLEFSKHFEVIGYDISLTKLKKLKEQIEKKTNKIFLTNISKNLKLANVYIVTVPTPILSNKKPDLKPILRASKIIAKVLKKKDLVIFESTVYPGLTEEVCVPILEKYSSLKYNIDFICGYSPERINLGDDKHLLPNIVKITSGSNLKASKIVDNLYRMIIKAGTYKAPSIKIAEAAKVIENSQRDLNIAFVNELSIIFDKLNIDTNEVLRAAATKWNFLNFKPGLVGGHCIGVDPYYLTFKSKKIGYNPKVILSGRKVNDSMSKFILLKLKIQMARNNLNYNKSNYLIMGATFKEDCDDFRNSKVFEIVDILNKTRSRIDIYDPNVTNIIRKKYKFINYPKLKYYDVILIAVSHKKFIEMGKKKIVSFAKKRNVIFDIKNIFYNEESFLKL